MSRGEEGRMMTTCNHLLDVGKRRNGCRLLDDGFCAKAELVVFIGTPTVSLTNNQKNRGNILDDVDQSQERNPRLDRQSEAQPSQGEELDGK